MEDSTSDWRTRQDVKLETLRCSDQLYCSQWRENVERLFQSKGQKSQLVVVLPSSLSSPKSGAETRVETVGSQEGDAGEAGLPDPTEAYYSEKFGKLDIVDYHHDPSVVAGETDEKSRTSGSLETVDDVRRLPMPHGALTIIHIPQSYSHGRLLVTEEVFEALLSRFGVFPRLKDILLYYGRRSLEVEVGPPRLQWNLRPLAVVEEGRVGAGFEIAYCLRYIHLNGRSDAPSPWSLRQFVVHQRFDCDTRADTWIFVSPPVEIQEICARFYPDTTSMGNAGDSLLQIHQALVHWAVAQWRPYLAFLTEAVDQHIGLQQTMALLVASHEQGGNVGLANFDVHQQLKQLEDDILDATLALKATRSCVEDMEQFLAGVGRQEKNQYVTSSVAGEIQSDIYRELALLLERADSLCQKLRSSIGLLSSFLDLESSYTLQQLSREAQKENKKMEEIATRSMKDAAAVKLLTIIMMVYLPATIVLNFFSTEFITKTLLPDGTATTSVDHDWTIMLVISAPLTAGTIGAWWLWTQLQSGGLRLGDRWARLRAPKDGSAVASPC